MKAHADGKTLREMLMRRAAGDERGMVAGGCSRGETALLDEIILEGGGVHALGGWIGGIFRRRAEHGGEGPVKLNELMRDGLALIGIGPQ